MPILKPTCLPGDHRTARATRGALWSSPAARGTETGPVTEAGGPGTPSVYGSVSVPEVANW